MGDRATVERWDPMVASDWLREHQAHGRVCIEDAPFALTTSLLCSCGAHVVGPLRREITFGVSYVADVKTALGLLSDPGQRALTLLARLLHRGQFSVTTIDLGLRLDGLTLQEAIEDVLRDAGVRDEPT